MESLEDTTAGLEIEVTFLDQRVENLEAGSSGANVTGILCSLLWWQAYNIKKCHLTLLFLDLTERVDDLEDVT